MGKLTFLCCLLFTIFSLFFCIIHSLYCCSYSWICTWLDKWQHIRKLKNYTSYFFPKTSYWSTKWRNSVIISVFSLFDLSEIVNKEDYIILPEILSSGASRFYILLCLSFSDSGSFLQFGCSPLFLVSYHWGYLGFICGLISLHHL